MDAQLAGLPSIETAVGSPTIGVVICAYTMDRWSLLERSIASVRAQTHRPEQVVLSVDHNPELAERAREAFAVPDATGLALDVVENRYPGRLGSARNTGVERLTTDIVAFLDDDAQAPPEWLAGLLQTYEETGATAVGGAPVPEFATERPDWFPPSYDWVFGCRYDGLPLERGPVKHLIGANMSVKVAALQAVGGFQSDNHDDMDMCHRVAARFGGEAVVYDPQITVDHFVGADRVTWTYFWRRCYFVNRGKVQAFADMEAAANLAAERAFAGQALKTVAGKVGRGIRGERGQLRQAGAIVAGLGLAGAGHLHGRYLLARGRTAPSLTRGFERA